MATGDGVFLYPLGPVALLNLSETGALVDAPMRPPIGTSVSLSLDGDDDGRIEGRVVRTRIVAIHPDDAMRYHVGIAFAVRTPLKLRFAQRSGTVIDSAPEFAGPRRPLQTDEPVNQWA